VLPADASNKNVTWTSSNKSVAIVSSTGLVTALERGAVVITATTEDGGKTGEAAVLVKDIYDDDYEDTEGGCSTGASAPAMLLLAAPLALVFLKRSRR